MISILCGAFEQDSGEKIKIKIKKGGGLGFFFGGGRVFNRFRSHICRGLLLFCIQNLRSSRRDALCLLSLVYVQYHGPSVDEGSRTMAWLSQLLLAVKGQIENGLNAYSCCLAPLLLA